jgi:hypothetical protein
MQRAEFEPPTLAEKRFQSFLFSFIHDYRIPFGRLFGHECLLELMRGCSAYTEIVSTVRSAAKVDICFRIFIEPDS